MKTFLDTSRTTAVGLAALVAALALPLASPAIAALPQGTGTALAIMQASEALSAEDCAGAKAPLTRLWNDPNIDAQDPGLAAQFRIRLIACTADTTGLKDALALSTDNITRTSSKVTAYDMHAFLQLMAQRPDAAADTLDAAMTRFPAEAGDISDLSMLTTLVLLHDSASGRALGLLDHAQQVGWQSHTLAIEPALGFLRLEGLRSAVAARRDDLAALYRADLKRDAMTYMISQGDGLVSSPTAAPEPVEPIAAAQITAAMKQVVATPTDLRTLAYLMTLERAAGQFETALIQLGGVLDLVDTYGLQNFEGADVYGELLADRALLLAALGRHDDALKSFKAAEARLKGANGGDFYVAYAGYLVARGDDAGAIALIDSLNVQAFSDVQKEALVAHDACAFARTGRTADYLTYMSVVGDPQMRIAPRLCAADTEGAASDLIAMIGAPVLRSDAILQMQAMRQHPAASAKQSEVQAALSALKARADVAGAAEAAAIIVRSWPLAY